MTYEIIQPYQHHVYRAKIGRFDIKVDIRAEEDGLWCEVAVTSEIKDVIFVLEEYHCVASIGDSYYEELITPSEIERISNLSNERLNELYAEVSE